MLLNELLEGPEQAPEPQLDIDVSDLFGKEPGEIIFSYREPTIPECFASGADAKKFKQQNPHWPANLSTTVALIALTHVSPPSSEPIGLMYAKIVEKRRKLFARITSKWMAAYPDALGDEAVTEAKND